MNDAAVTATNCTEPVSHLPKSPITNITTYQDWMSHQRQPKTNTKHITLVG